MGIPGLDERNLFLGKLPGTRGVEVFYTWHEGREGSHRVEFRRKGRTVFELFLPGGISDLPILAGILSDPHGGTPPEEVFGFLERQGIRLKGGRPVRAAHITATQSRSVDTPLIRGRSGRQYRMAWFADGGALLVSSRDSTQSGVLGSGGGSSYNWQKLDPGEARCLAEMILALLERVAAS